MLNQRVPHLTSVEIDDRLAEMLSERFADVPSVEIVNGDATALAFSDRRFSGATSFTMLHHVPTVELQDRLFGELARVLRHGAPLAPATVSAARSWPHITKTTPATPSTRPPWRTA